MFQGEPPSPEQLHPALWRAHQLGRQRAGACASGFAALDAQLPGGGWPTQGLTELLLAHPGIGEVRLLAPALAAVQRNERSVIWFDPPALPCGWTLAALGLDLRHLLVVRGRPRPAGPARQARHAVGARAEPHSDILWAIEHALKSGHVGAVLAWLPQRVRPDALRRLQLAAQSHDGPAFLLREPAACHKPSAAPLRLRLQACGPDELAVTLLKRRGPPLLQPLRLSVAPVLAAPARARALQAAALRAAPAALAAQA